MKNNYEIRGDITAIFLSSPKYGQMEALISTNKLKIVEDFPNMFYAIYSENTDSFYAVANFTKSRCYRRLIQLSRLICGTTDELKVDHINHDTLNNTDSNIRIVTNAENSQNKKGAQRNSASGIRGVIWHKFSQKWNVQLRVSGKKMSFGYFNDILEAEQVAIEARRKYMPYSQEAS